MRLLNDEAMSAAMAATVNGAAFDCQHVGMLSIVGKNSGVATTGVLKLQGSNDDKDAVDWADIPSATVNITSVGVYTVSVAQLTYKWVRAVYTQVSGTGTIVVRIMGKGF